MIYLFNDCSDSHLWPIFGIYRTETWQHGGLMVTSSTSAFDSMYEIPQISQWVYCLQWILKTAMLELEAMDSNVEWFTKVKW